MESKINTLCLIFAFLCQNLRQRLILLYSLHYIHLFLNKQEKDREHELHDLQYSTGSKVAHLAGAKHHREAETTRRNSIFTKDMKAQQMPNALKPEEQEMLNSFRSQCETMKHLVA